jgi:1-deoxy-D-xylulose-5-phosphate synthase
VLKGAPPLFELAKRFEESAMGIVKPITLFEKFGFNYVGPIDGHDVETLVSVLENIRHLKGPQFLHVVTKKGQGYKLAEVDPIAYHGPGKFDPAVGLQKNNAVALPTFTQVFGDWLCDMAAADDRLVAITPAMREGSGMVEFEKRFPKRFFDVGIAEQHAVTFAAGLACEGLKPVVAIYSTFLQRAYDQLIHDVAIQNLPVVFALDRAGLVGADGATHAGAYDIPYLRCIPNISLACPANENECRQLLSSAYAQDPARWRCAIHEARRRCAGAINAGRAGVWQRRDPSARRRQGGIILVFGTLLYAALEVAIGSMPPWSTCAGPSRWTLRCCAGGRSHHGLVTLEEGALMGGAGSAEAWKLWLHQGSAPVLQLGLRDEFIEHGDPAKLLALQGLDASGIEASVRARFFA